MDKLEVNLQNMQALVDLFIEQLQIFYEEYNYWDTREVVTQSRSFITGSDGVNNWVLS